MLYSRSTQYAIRALAHLVSLPRGKYAPVRTLARDARVPLPFLAKIMQSLARRGLISSLKGPGGGVCLARSPRDITLGDIVMAVDGRDPGTSCVLGLPRCSEVSPCVVHHVWKHLREDLQREMHQRTLAELAADGAAPRRRERARRARTRG